jgi:hypothetical protein
MQLVYFLRIVFQAIIKKYRDWRSSLHSRRQPVAGEAEFSTSTQKAEGHEVTRRTRSRHLDFGSAQIQRFSVCHIPWSSMGLCAWVVVPIDWLKRTAGNWESLNV